MEGITTAETAASFHFFEALLDAEAEAHPDSKRFYNYLIEAGLTHAQKQRDYGRDHDPFANVRASEEWGIPAWVGAMVRLNDKVRRLQSFAVKGELHNESAKDSLIDIAVYALIALVLYGTAPGTGPAAASPVPAAIPPVADEHRTGHENGDTGQRG